MRWLKWLAVGKRYSPRIRSLTYVLNCLMTVMIAVAPVLAYGVDGEVLLENVEVRGFDLLSYCPYMMIALLMPVMNLAVYYLSLPQRMKLLLYGLNAVVYGVCLIESIFMVKSAMEAASAFPVTFLPAGHCMPIAFVLNLWIPIFEAVLNCLYDAEKEERMVM